LAERSSETVVVDLTEQIKTVTLHAIAQGGFADIHLGEWENEIRSEDGSVRVEKHQVRQTLPVVPAFCLFVLPYTYSKTPFMTMPDDIRLLSSCCVFWQGKNRMVYD
jgi:hypothetical protein